MPFTVLHKSVFVINTEDQAIEYREIPDDFNSYISVLMDEINKDENIRRYKIRSANTEVYRTCLENIMLIESAPIELDLIIQNCHAVAQRLLIKENQANAIIERMGRSVQKGCLVQAIMHDTEAREFVYLLAKVDHSPFFDELDFTEKAGFSKNQRKQWKSCAITYTYNDAHEYENTDIRIYLQNKAEYWNSEFLEFDPLNKDEENTRKAFHNIEGLISRMLKDESPADYIVLRNSLIGYMRRSIQFDYDNLIGGVFRDFQPVGIGNDAYQKIMDKLATLPESKGFDRQFDIISGVITKRIKKVYAINNNIELKLNDYVNNLKDLIKSEEDDSGIRYIKIKTNDPDTYEAFK